MAGYISGASYELNGFTVNTPANANNGTATYNGGENGWEHRGFDVVSHSQNSVTFITVDRNKPGTIPGSCGGSIQHYVGPYEWRVAYGVTPTRVTHPIPINLSLKTYWNLDGFVGPDKRPRTVAEHRLHLPFSGLRLEEDAGHIPTGDIKANRQGSAYDFWSSPKHLGEGIAQTSGRGYDDLFLVSRRQPWERDSTPVASLSSPLSGVTVSMYTEEEALRIITWDEPDCK